MIAFTMTFLDAVAITPDPRGTINHSIPLTLRLSSDSRSCRYALSKSNPVMRGGSSMAAQPRHYDAPNPEPFCTAPCPRHCATPCGECIPVQAGVWMGEASAKKGRRSSICVCGARVLVHPLLFYHLLVPPAQGHPKFYPLNANHSECPGRYRTPSKVSKMGL